MSYPYQYHPTSTMAISTGTSNKTDEYDDDEQHESTSFTTSSRSGRCDGLLHAFLRNRVATCSIFAIMMVVVVMYATSDEQQQTTPDEQQQTAPDEQQQTSSFPDMNDIEVGPCGARILVELEHRHSNGLPMPFSFFLYNNSMTCVKNADPYSKLMNNDPECGHGYEDPAKMSYWLEHCGNPATPWTPLANFILYYDECPASLRWDSRPCEDVIQETMEHPRSNGKWNDQQTTVPLVGGEFNGTVLAGDSDFTSIFVRDALSDSCWHVEAGRKNASETIQFVQAALTRVSLEEFVHYFQDIWCD